MSETLLIAILQFAVKFGIDAALAIARGVKGGATIDDAIAALEQAKTKTWDQYKAEADTAAVTAPVTEPPPVP